MKCTKMWMCTNVGMCTEVWMCTKLSHHNNNRIRIERTCFHRPSKTPEDRQSSSSSSVEMSKSHQPVLPSAGILVTQSIMCNCIGLYNSQVR